MRPVFLHYPSCSTCRKARKWLDDNGIEYTARLIVEERPATEELKEWIGRSGLPVKRFFNTSGLAYKKMNLKDKLPALNEEEQIALLASDGKLIKRPLLVTEKRVLAGFKENQWQESLLQEGLL